MSEPECTAAVLRTLATLDGAKVTFAIQHSVNGDDWAHHPDDAETIARLRNDVWCWQRRAKRLERLFVRQRERAAEAGNNDA